MNRLQSLLKQAVIKAEHNSQEIQEAERRYVRDIGGERVKTRTARATPDELRHRLKNTLAVVQAIAHATLRPDVATEEARDAFGARLQALAHAHDILFDSHWGSVGLRTIIDGIFALYRESGMNWIRVKRPEVCLSAKPALALEQAMHDSSNDEGT